MKNQMFALIGLGLLLATASAYAQTGVVKANVPFNFIVNNTDLPAGRYTLQNIGTVGAAMVIESPDRSPMELKTFEDWVVEPQYRAVPGVADDSGFGGGTIRTPAACKSPR
jgi:hypothetical protein